MKISRNLLSCLTASAILCAIFSTIASPAAFGQSMNAEGGPCSAPASTAETASCFDNAYKLADHDLNILYGRIQKTVQPNELAALVQAERLWVKYRDATCNAERTLYGGGSGGSPTYLACLSAETEARHKSLLRSYGWRLEKFGI